MASREWTYFDAHLLETTPIAAHETIKEIEQRLGDPTVEMQSFIVSNTRADVISGMWNMQKPEMQQLHIVFQEDGAATYIREILEGIGE